MPNIVEILITATNEAGKALAETEASGQKMGNTLTKVGGIIGVALAATAVTAVHMAGDYESAVTRLGTSAGESQKNIGMVSQGMLDMASKVGTSAQELATGMYTVESAGYHGADGLTVLKAAAQGAKDENANLGDVANAVTDILKDYHLSASQAGNATSQMVTAVSFGKTNFELFSKALANVVPIAAAAHLKFSDVSGALAEMTAHGMPAQKASQNLAQAIRSLVAPSGTMQAEFKKVGITADEVGQSLSKRGLSGTMEWLSQIAQKFAGGTGPEYVATLKKLMGTAPGLSAALMTTGENAKETSDAIKGIGKSTTDAKGDVIGFSEISKTFNFQLGQIEAAAKTLMIEFGQKLLPVIQDLFNFIGSHSTEFLILAKVIGTIAAAILIYTTAAKAAELATKAWAVAQAILDGTFEASPFGLVVLGIAAIVVAVLYLWNHFEGFRNFWKAAWADAQAIFDVAWQAIKTAASAAWEWLQPIFNSIAKLGKEIISDIEAWWKEHGAEVVAVAKAAWALIQADVQIAWTVVSTVIKVAWDIISGIFKTYIPPLITILEGAWNTISGAVRLAWTLISNAIKIAFDTIMAIVNVGLDLLTGHWHQAWTDFVNYLKQIWDALKSVASSGLSAIEQLLSGAVGILRGVWSGVTSILTAPFSSAWSTISSIIGDIRSAVSTIGNIGGSIVGAVTGHASGGIIGAASGGARSNMTMVGEYGRELVKLPAGSRVYSNPDTESMLGGGGGGGGGVSGTIVIQSDGTDYSEFLAQELKRLARIRGNGNLQLAIVGRA